jgi:hypothetical protein
VTALVHLVWGPLGTEPLRRFLRAYAERDAGRDHELVLLLNGLDLPGAGSRETIEAELAATPHRAIEISPAVQDLDAYVQVAAELHEHASIVFLNSYARPLADGWLALLAGALEQPAVGLVGASGNWESLAEWRRGPLQHWPLQMLGAARARTEYPRFPNPHIRTSSWAIGRELLLSLDLPAARDKQAAYRIESGRESITRRIYARGLRAVVVGRDGQLFDAADWPVSRTFRSGEQQNLLVADNQTEAYLGCAPAARRRFRRDSWGRQDSG